MNKRTHISIPENVHNLINDYAIKNGINYSQAVAKLIESGINNIELNKSINSYSGLLDRIFSKLYYNTKLLEQFYSDMEIDDTTNPNKNKGLEKFKAKFNKSNYEK